MVFKSAIDWWFWLVIIFSAGVLIATAMTVWQAGAMTALWVIALSAILAVGFPLWLTRATDYTITDDQLLVRAGPFKWQIQRAEITHVRLSNNPISSPALSLNRLEISYGSRSLLISPAEQQAFIDALGVPVE